MARIESVTHARSSLEMSMNDAAMFLLLWTVRFESEAVETRVFIGKSLENIWTVYSLIIINRHVFDARRHLKFDWLTYFTVKAVFFHLEQDRRR